MAPRHCAWEFSTDHEQHCAARKQRCSCECAGFRTPRVEARSIHHARRATSRGTTPAHPLSNCLVVAFPSRAAPLHLESAPRVSEACPSRHGHDEVAVPGSGSPNCAGGQGGYAAVGGVEHGQTVKGRAERVPLHAWQRMTILVFYVPPVLLRLADHYI